MADITHVFRIGVFAIIEHHGEILLARRRDNGWWNLPGGGMEPGETLEVALRREVLEEIGIDISIDHLVGAYSKPQKTEVVLTFWCHPASGTPASSEEMAEVAWFAAEGLPEHLLPKHRQRVLDALRQDRYAVVADQTTTTEEDQGSIAL